MKPMTATEIEEGWAKGCTCDDCDYCHVCASIKVKQEGIFKFLIERAKEILKR